MAFSVRAATDQSGWDDFVLRAGDPDRFLQSWAWGEFQSKVGRRIQRFELIQDDRRVGVCLLIPHTTKIGRSFLLAPRGPIIDPSLSVSNLEAVWSVLLKTIEQERPSNTMFLKIEPNRTPPESIGVTVGTPTHPETTLLIDLRKTDDQLQTEMHPKTRYNITLAKRRGVNVRWTRDTGDIDLFLQLLQSTAKRQSIGIHPERYYRTMIEALGSGAEVAIADQAGLPLAAGLMIRFGDVTTYLHGASDHTYRELMAPHALHWETIRRSRAQGSATYDFYGIAPADAIDHKWAGITRFKKGFGGQVRKYPGAFNLIYDRTWYYAYRFAKRVTGR